jgi:hypothetical protein
MPVNNLTEWLANRIKAVTEDHDWKYDHDSELYRWAWGVEQALRPGVTHHHHAEPPTPIVIGYIGQIAFNIGNAPANTPTDPVGVGAMQVGALGLVAAGTHGCPQTEPPNIPADPESFDPVVTLTSWICERLEHLADGTNPNCQVAANWASDLENWAVELNDMRDPPSTLALGYVLHCACNYCCVASTDADPWVFESAGVIFALADGRPGPFSDLDSPAVLSKEKIARAQELIRTRAYNR